MTSYLDEDIDALARAGNLEETILAYVGAYDWVTFTELQRKLGEHFNLRGDRCLELWPNGIIWLNMSEVFSETILKLKEEGRLAFAPADWLTYFIDRGVLDLPIAKRPPRNKDKGYARPRWIPTCLRLPEQANK